MDNGYKKSTTEMEANTAVCGYRKRSIDMEMLERAGHLILEAIGEDPYRNGLIETPARFAKMMAEVCSGMEHSAEEWGKEFEKTFADAGDDFSNEDANGMGDMVIVKDIPIYSLCEHHLVPFIGTVSVGYIPTDKIIGISKIARLARALASRPQVQERLTAQIGDTLMEMLGCGGVMVVANCRHLCMESRGVKISGASTTTSCVRGIFKEDDRTRQEFLNLIR